MSTDSVEVTKDNCNFGGNATVKIALHSTKHD